MDASWSVRSGGVSSFGSAALPVGELGIFAYLCGTTLRVRHVICRDTYNVMTIFYWTMSILIVATFVPAVLYLVLYAATGEDAALARAKVLWNISRVFALMGVNLLIWGHVVVAFWRLAFR